jgi:hypothetical protein
MTKDLKRITNKYDFYPKKKWEIPQKGHLHTENTFAAQLIIKLF